MIDRRPLPDLALTAHALLMAEFERRERVLSAQLVDILNLKEADNWTIDFTTRQMSREVPDPVPTFVPDPPTTGRRTNQRKKPRKSGLKKGSKIVRRRLP